MDLSNSSNSLFCLLKALITLAPSSPSRVSSVTLSSLFCTFLNRGMLSAITPNTTIESAGMVTTNVMADFTSMVNDMIMAPNTMNGERRNSLSTMLTPVCTWFVSLVILVSSVDVPMLSISVYESDVICLNRSFRSAVPNPVAAFAEKYWAVIEHTRPIIPKSIMTRHIFTT